MLEDYKHLYWTRLMTIANYEVGQERKYPLGPDVVEECQAVAALPPADPDTWTPLFEPTDFTQANQPLLVEKFRLSPAALESWAERSVRLRLAILEKAKQIAVDEPDELHDQNSNPDLEASNRSLCGHKRSKRAHN